MYAIIAHGNQQYKVEEGQTLAIDFSDAKAGSEFTFDRVLAVSGEGGFRLGRPTVTGATVRAKVIEAVEGEKVHIQKARRRKNYRRRIGHRQRYLKVLIEEIA